METRKEEKRYIHPMVRTVYVDLLFLINFSMDFLCFFLVSRLLAHPLSLGRTILASVLGGIYAVLSVLFTLRGALLWDILACTVMCIVADARRGMGARRLMRGILVYTGVSMALGGIMTAIYSLLNEAGIPELLLGEADGVSSWLFLLLALIGGGVTLLGSRFFRRNTERREYEVTIRICGKEATFHAVVDTGNALCDPISGIPAAALDVSAARKLLPRDFCIETEYRPADLLADMPLPYRSRARLLPVNSVTGTGMLLAFRPDVCLVRLTGEHGDTYEEKELLIALAPVTLEDNEMLLPPGIL